MPVMKLMDLEDGRRYNVLSVFKGISKYKKAYVAYVLDEGVLFLNKKCYVVGMTDDIVRKLNEGLRNGEIMFIESRKNGNDSVDLTFSCE